MALADARSRYGASVSLMKNQHTCKCKRLPPNTTCHPLTLLAFSAHTATMKSSGLVSFENNDNASVPPPVQSTIDQEATFAAIEEYANQDVEMQVRYELFADLAQRQLI